MKPYVLRRANGLQLRYVCMVSCGRHITDGHIRSHEVPHRIFSTLVYPVQAPNGSTVVVYGHQDGLRILWSGGKSVNRNQEASGKPKVNGAESKDAMVIDLDDDEPTAEEAAVQQDFYNEDVDSSEPYDQILRHVDIDLGSAVRHLAIPSVPESILQSTPGAYPPLFLTHVVVAAACEDQNVQLITLPLIAPASDNTQLAGSGTQIIKIAGPAFHQDPINSISVTHTRSSTDTEDDQGASRSRSRGNNAQSPSKNSRHWMLMIASVSSTAGGLLLIHQLDLSDNSLAASEKDHAPWQRHHLRTSLLSSRVRFNTSLYPSERHSTLLITCPEAGCVEIYQIRPEPKAATLRGRRGSAALIESTVSSSRSIWSGSSRHGIRLLTLHAGFANEEASHFARRKRVIDASWVLGGRAVVALLEDGEWGVWDVEGAGPAPTTGAQNLLRGQSSATGLQGGALAKFSLRGYVNPQPSAAPKAQKLDTKAAETGQLMPMTPHTRKTRSKELFQSANSGATPAGSHNKYIKGSVSVNTKISSQNTSASTLQDESILLNYGSANVSIPSLMALWKAETVGRGSLDTSNALRPTSISARLGGEQQNCIVALPCTTSEAPKGLFGQEKMTKPDVLVTTDHRLIMLVTPIQESSQAQAKSSITAPAPPSTDQLLLKQGDLDIDGMDRILDNMTGGAMVPSQSFGKSVGFDLDDDGDVGMCSPTPGLTTRLRNTSGRKGARLFS